MKSEAKLEPIPLPWEATENLNQVGTEAAVWGPDGDCVALVYCNLALDGDALATAQFIAKSANQHAHLVARNAALVAALEESLPRIEQWTQAYPTEFDFFAKPDFAKVQELLGATLLTQVSASNMRHVITRVWEILEPVRAALQSTEAEAKP